MLRCVSKKKKNVFLFFLFFPPFLFKFLVSILFVFLFIERGMRAYGLNKATLKHQLNQWLDLSVNQNVPISLLVISRALAITAKVRHFSFFI